MYNCDSTRTTISKTLYIQPFTRVLLAFQYKTKLKQQFEKYKTTKINKKHTKQKKKTKNKKSRKKHKKQKQYTIPSLSCFNLFFLIVNSLATITKLAQTDPIANCNSSWGKLFNRNVHSLI